MNRNRYARRDPRDRRPFQNRNSRPRNNAPAEHRAIPIEGELKVPMTGAFATLIPELQHAVASEGYTTPTAIQEQAITPVIEGKDLLGCAQTGTGKTAAFALPILQRLAEHPHKGNDARPIRALVLSPTRELANQITDSFKTYGKHLNVQHTAVYGGVSQVPQVNQLRRGVDILVATPGRLMDLMEQGHIRLGNVEMFVLDEADRMMDMGFIGDIRKIITKMAAQRQNMMFSATMPRKIRELAQSILRDPVEIHVAPNKPSVDAIEQSLYMVDGNNKFELLKHVLEDNDVTRAIVFIRTKRRADNLEKQLKGADITVDVIHSDRSQRQRDRTINNFRGGKTRILVASDVVARGLDVDDISHVINYDMPEEAETYVHRIGRTGRAGAKGLALSFCAGDEYSLLKDVERHLRKDIPCVPEHPFKATRKPARRDEQRTRGGQGGRSGGSRGGNGGRFNANKRRSGGGFHKGGKRRPIADMHPA